jgi:hypothetical protein
MAITLVHDCDVERRPEPQALDGDFRDCFMDQIAPDGTHGMGNHIDVGVHVPGGKGSEYETRGLVLFDLLKFIPASAVIIAAVWWFYVQTTDAAPGHNFRAVRCRRHDWKEDEATWNAYKTGSNWAAAGASDVTADRDQAVLVSIGTLNTTGWKNINFLTLVSDAWSNRSGICTFIFERFDVFMADTGAVFVYAKDIGDSPGYKWAPHHLRITYTLDGRTFQALVR